MKKAVRPSPFAKVEIESYLLRYETKSARLRDRLWDDIEHVVGLISDFPSIGEPVRRTGGRVRRFPLKHFPFFVIYRDRPSDIQIVALAHKRRKPTYWRYRLRFD